MRILDKLIPNQIACVNSHRLHRDEFKDLLNLDFSLPCFVCLTNFNDVAPLFEWLGLEKVDEVYNHNSSRTNHLYTGMLKKDRLETLLEDGSVGNILSLDFLKQFHKTPKERFVAM